MTHNVTFLSIMSYYLSRYQSVPPTLTKHNHCFKL